MTRVAILRFVGDLQKGLQVTLEWGQSSQAIEGRRLGRLQANPSLGKLYGDWQHAYRNLEELYRYPRLELEPSPGVSRDICDRAAEALEEHLNHWLDSDANDFQAISRQLNRELSLYPNSQILIQTDDPQLQRLPWHLWHFWHYHEEAEIILSPLEYQKIKPNLKGDKTRVLAVLGNGQEINVSIDRELLQEVPNIHPESRFLEEPSRTDLAEALRDSSGWDILFFAGHSCSERGIRAGRIYINSTESLTLCELKTTLKQAIDNGLKLAIFNSCDGLGLANSLAELQIPQTIVMREPVPDEVAHRFLAFFLEDFSQGKTLVEAVRQARERLESLQDKLPYATWLPVLYKHPCAQPLVWQSANLTPPKSLRLWAVMGIGGLILAGGWFSQASLPKTQVLGDRISAGEEILDNSTVPRLKRRGVDQIAKCQAASVPYWPLFRSSSRKLWDQCIHKRTHQTKAVQLLTQSWQEDQHDPETLIYLNNAFLEAQQLDFVTIAVAVPILKNEDNSVKDTALAQEQLRGVAQLQTEVNLALASSAKASSQTSKALTLPGQGVLVPRPLRAKVGLKVVILDDSNNSAQVKEQAQFLIQQKEILGLVGHYASEMTMATTEIYNRHGLTMVSPGSTTEELTEELLPYFFRTVPTTGIEAQSLVDYLVEQGHRKAVVLHNLESPFTASLWEEFEERFIAAYDPIGPTQPRDRPQVESLGLAKTFDAQKVLAKIEQLDSLGDPNAKTAIVLIPDGQVTNSFENALALIQLNQGRNPIAGSWGLDSPRTLALQQAELFQQFAIAVPWHRLNSPNSDFPNQAQALWGMPVNSRTATAYDAALVIVEAINRQDKPTRAGVREQLVSKDFMVEGATGEIKFDPETGDRLNPPQTLLHILPCAHQESELAFAPLEFSSPEEIRLSCNF